MTNYYVTYKLNSKEARDGYLKEVQENGVVEKSRAEEGCIRYTYFYPVESETELFLTEAHPAEDRSEAVIITAAAKVNRVLILFFIFFYLLTFMVFLSFFVWYVP